MFVYFPKVGLVAPSVWLVAGGGLSEVVVVVELSLFGGDGQDPRSRSRPYGSLCSGVTTFGNGGGAVG